MKSILDYLERSAERFPDKTAFADENKEITFSQLKERAQRAASVLTAYNCVRRPVPVLMEKGVDTICVMMGIVYAGGFYVMLDSSQPVERLNQILKTLQADVMVVSKENADFVPKLSFDGTVLEEDSFDDAAVRPLEQIRSGMKDTDPLYVLFTSGSTGVPKGVVVCHRSVIDFINVFTDAFSITRDDVLGNQAPWDFDVSVKDIYSGLCTGACVQIIPRKLFSFPMLLLDFLEERKVTNLTWAVSALVIVSIMNGLEYKVPACIRRVMFSGETMPIRHLNYWRRYYPEARFVNLYGPTEITCNCTYYELDREFEAGDMLPIGRAFDNETVLLLDENDRLVTDQGVSGEICVAGTALALGYYRNPEQTAKAFVQNPLNDCYPELIYRTGDLGYYNENGELCFTSRKDFQIKHMGHRIELGEIESALDKVEQVQRSCCLFDQNKNKIVCFYQGSIDKGELRRTLEQYLPAFMIPNRFKVLDALPMTKNGKINRTALKELL